MNLIKKYKNIIILISIVLLIFASTSAIDFAKSIAKSVENYFSKKSDYSNLSNQSYKYQSTLKSSKSTSSESNSKNSSSANTNSIFKNSNKKTIEELDKEIMNKSTQNSQSRDIRFNDNRLKRQMNDKKNKDEEFQMDFKELDDF